VGHQNLRGRISEKVESRREREPTQRKEGIEKGKSLKIRRSSEESGEKKKAKLACALPLLPGDARGKKDRERKAIAQSTAKKLGRE